MTYSAITTKGQIVIPSAIRKRLNLKKGTRFCIMESEGKVILQPLTKGYFDQLAGIFKTGGALTKDLLAERRKEKDKEDRP